MSMARYMAFTLYIGAANKDATEVQRAQLRTRLQPHLEQLRTATTGKVVRNALKGALEEVHSVMGPDWKAKGEWATAIQNLTKKR